MNTRRIRTLTHKAMDIFKDKVSDFENRLSVKESRILTLLSEELSSNHVSQITELEDSLKAELSSYEATGVIYMQYLDAAKTTESEHLKSTFDSHLRTLRSNITTHLHEIESKKQLLLEDIISRSIHSSRSRGSASTSIQSKEDKLKKEKLLLEESLKAVNAGLQDIKLGKSKDSIKDEAKPKIVEHSVKEETDTIDCLSDISQDEKLNYFFDTCDNAGPSTNVHQDLSNYILKKELLFSRITNFTDNPTHYQSWKASLKQVVKEIKLNYTEEVDLLIKYLGPESKQQALTLKTVYRMDPNLCKVKIWERLDERYGAPEIVNKLIQNRVEQLPRLNLSDSTRWYDLDDLCSEIQALKGDPAYCTSMAFYDSSMGISSIVEKLPHSIQERWATRASRYKTMKNTYFPPFAEFATFIHEQAKLRNDPSLHVALQQSQKPQIVGQQPRKPPFVSTKKTDISASSSESKQPNGRFCAYHNTSHSLNKCRAFRRKSLSERKQFLREKDICFRCCEFNNHKANECRVSIHCCVCGNSNHPGALHVEQTYSGALATQGGETEQGYRDRQSDQGTISKDIVSNKCTQICGLNQSKSCAKLVLVNVVNSKHPDKIVQCYAMLDDQSNRSLAKPKLFDLLNIESKDTEYTINSCAGTYVTHGRRACDCSVSAVDGSVTYSLPTLIECSDIPNNRNEICVPDEVRYHPHLSHIAGLIPEINEQADILLLIGRDLVDVHHIEDQIVGPPGSPFAQKVGLGWVVVGEMCLGRAHAPDVVNVNKIHVLSRGRPTFCEPCTNQFHVEEKVDHLYDPVFDKHVDDDKPAFSVEDREFLHVMDHGFRKNSKGRWTAPLPFKSPRQRMPNNRSEALRRARSLHTSLQRNPDKKCHMVEFMHKILINGHAEIAPDLSELDERWYLPIFGVYNPKKPGQIRAVFDSSAKFQGVSLNSVLLSGPDLTNSLLGVLLRFRRDKVAISADIEQMFYCFEVDEVHRNFLRFFWYQDNDTEKPLIEYQMSRHVFGNSPSPAIATYGLHKSVEESEEDVKVFVNQDFYVDDGLTSLPSVEQAVDLLTRTQVALGNSSLRLHKIASNDVEVMRSFPVDDLGKDLKSIDLGECLPMQRSLGLGWDLNSDSFVFNVEVSCKPPSRRGILSTVNSVFDPLGFLAPFTIVGKLILRDIVSDQCEWDDPVSPQIKVKWQAWENSLGDLSSFKVPRSYLRVPLRDVTQLALHVFCDASEIAVSAAAYLVGKTISGVIHTGFVLGKSKVAPKKGHTIPRLELCGALLGVEIAQTAVEQLKVNLHAIKFYTDSKVVLGYINNQTRRFYTYVANRVQKIRSFSQPNQWNYVSSDLNPADVGSRGASPIQLLRSSWLTGPDFLSNPPVLIPEFFPVVNPEKDNEIRPVVTVSATSVQSFESLGSQRFERFSSWFRLVCAISLIRHRILCHINNKQSECQGYNSCLLTRNPDFQMKSEILILKVIQSEFYKTEIGCLKGRCEVPRDSSILPLDPFLDESGLLRVGGRLSRSDLTDNQKHPVIVPGKTHVAKLLVRHFHGLVQHQGRQLTEGAIRDSGYWIIGGKRLISSYIFNCVTCKRLRGRFQEQKMSDLPQDRVRQAAPFTYVGVDVFGPWSVVARRTRGGQASSKRWAVLFTCLTVRAIHIEVIDEMSSSAFINALRRFMSVRGSVKQFRSDRGSNFVGATDHLNVHAINVEDERSRSFLQSHKCQWMFNAPHSSHMGGSWERMIGVARRILESMLLSVSNLTHDVLITLMAEVTAIVNSRPIVPVSSDPDNPEILSPSLLLTSKTPCELGNHGNLDFKDLYRAQWRRVQHLADQFWSKWQREYLNTLQKRRKWNYNQVPLDINDVVLLKDREVHRNCWPLGIVSRTFPSEDNKIRKVEVKIVKDGKITYYTRPVVELVLLVKK